MNHIHIWHLLSLSLARSHLPINKLLRIDSLHFTLNSSFDWYPHIIRTCRGILICSTLVYLQDAERYWLFRLPKYIHIQCSRRSGEIVCSAEYPTQYRDEWRVASRADSVQSCGDVPQIRAFLSRCVDVPGFTCTRRYYAHLVRRWCVLHRWPVRGESSFVRQGESRSPCAYAIRICEMLHIRTSLRNTDRHKFRANALLEKILSFAMHKCDLSIKGNKIFFSV